jgi:hypothetical protein
MAALRYILTLTAGGQKEWVPTTGLIDLSGKVDKIPGKGLSTNDYTTEDKAKLTNASQGTESLTWYIVDGGKADSVYNDLIIDGNAN